MSSPESTTERRLRRAGWPVRVTWLGDQDGSNLSASTSPTERLVMMWPLAVEAFSVAGQFGPELPRSQWPVMVTKLCDQ